jgi:PmbA protein
MKKPISTSSAPSAPSKTPASSASSTANRGFAYTLPFFASLVDQALDVAKKLGASDAAADVSESCGLSVSVRNGELENVERNRDKSLGVTVYLGQRRGNASTSDFSDAAIAQTVRAALDIARFTAQDAFANLPDEKDIAPASERERALDLFFPWEIDSHGAAQIAMACEAAALQVDRRISNSEGAAVSAQQSQFFSAHTHGFRGGYASSRHSLSVSPIAGTGDDMQRDAWYSSMRCAQDLASPDAIGRYAAERALSRLGARRIPTQQCPVLFESPLAAGLLGTFVQAVSGGALYRKSSFLLDSLGKQVFPKHLDIFEDPFVLRGKGSSPFDDEGVRVQARQVVNAGKVQGYFLGSYSARKLGMQTTGNAGGSHNLVLTSRLTRPEDDLDAMLKKLGTGLLVTELMGQGVNYVTGDYSRGASGFWVENGQIAYPVHEITIAGNMKAMFKGIEAIGADLYNYGAKSVGSILINRMQIAGT